MAIATSTSLLVALAKYVIRGKKAQNTTRTNKNETEKSPKANEAS
jgi:hypothetical protein